MILVVIEHPRTKQEVELDGDLWTDNALWLGHQIKTIANTLEIDIDEFCMDMTIYHASSKRSIDPWLMYSAIGMALGTIEP